jgi:hypothetical protein
MPVVIDIDVTDWAEEYAMEEVDLSSPEALVDAQQDRGYSPTQGGRMLAIAKHRGETFEEIPGHKLMLQLGAARSFVNFFTQMKERVTLKSGKEVEVRSYVAQADGDEDEDPAYVEWTDDKALDRAEDYLLKRVPGHIRGRLALFAARGREKQMRTVVQVLHQTIDELVEDLMEPND